MSRRTRVTAVLASLTAVVAAGLVAPAAARADDTCTISWNGGSGSWSDATRWSPARVPTADDDVCIVRAAGASTVSVRVTAPTTVFHVTLRGATLSVLPQANFLDLTYLDASRATLTGGGAIRGSSGIVDLTDTALRGARLSTSGGLRLNGAITFTGGSTVYASGFTDPRPGVRIVDGDGNAANHVTVANFPLYLSGSLFVGVRLELFDAAVFAQGDVVLAHLDNLDVDGTLTSGSTLSEVQLGVGAQGSLTLQRSITSIERRVNVQGGEIRTADGSDALRTVRRVDGTLGLDRPLVTYGPISVGGYLNGNAGVAATNVTVRANGTYYGGDLSGALTCGGACILDGSHLGRLTVLAGGRISTGFDRPISVDGVATLAGRLDVALPFRGGVPAGTTRVVLTAAKGVTGTFDTVTTSKPGWAVTPGYQSTYVTGTAAPTP